MRSIRTKLWFSMMIMIGIIIVLLWMFQIVFLDKFYTVFEIGDVKSGAEGIANSIGNLDNLSQIDSSEQIVKEIENLVYDKQISAEIIDKDYNVIYRGASGGDSSMPGMMNASFSNVIAKTLEGEESTKEIVHPKFGYRFMIIGIPILNKNSVEGAIIISLPMASIDKTTEILFKQLIIITGILVIVSIFVSSKLSKSFTEPILKISRQADCYAQGEYSVRIKDIQDDEIGKLSNRMNDMGEALVRNAVLQKELIANVSHELRTPLTLIRGYAETLRDVTGDNAQKREKQLGIIIEESERLDRIVGDILNLSQLQAGATVLEIGSFSLSDILYSIKEHYEVDRIGKKLELCGVNELSENLVGDKNKIQQVFYNLIGNAFRHSDEDKPVEVKVLQQNEKVRIEVKDYGEGIDEKDITHVFERYYKGKRTDGKKNEGTGLGLAIVKNILELHHAGYGVQSKIGEGTTFWFELEKENSHNSF